MRSTNVSPARGNIGEQRTSVLDEDTQSDRMAATRLMLLEAGEMLARTRELLNRTRGLLAAADGLMRVSPQLPSFESGQSR